MINTNIDIGLAVLCIVCQRGQTLSHADIAAVCDCSRHQIAKIEKTALAKLEKIAQRRLYLYDFLRPEIDLPIEQHH